MEIFCPTCGKCYRVPDKKLSDQVKKVRCKACRNVFTLQPNDSEKQSGKDGNPLFALREMESSAQENSGTPDVLKPEKSEAEVESPHAGGNPASVDRDFLLESDKGEGSRDYLAIAVILAAIVTLGIVSFLGIRKMDRDSFFQPLRSISRLTDFFERKGFRSTEKAPRRKGSKSISYQTHLNRGHGYYRSKNYRAALREYNLAIQADATRYEAYYWRGQLRGLQRDYRKTIEDMLRVLQLNPSHMRAHRSLGWTYCKMGRYDDAIAVLDRYLKFNAKDGWAFYERALCYSGKGDRARALENAKKACELGFKPSCDVSLRFQ